MYIKSSRQAIWRRFRYCISGVQKVYWSCLLFLLVSALVVVSLRWKHSSQPDTHFEDRTLDFLSFEPLGHSLPHSSDLTRLHGGSADEEPYQAKKGGITPINLEELGAELIRRRDQTSGNRRVVYHNAQPCRNGTDFSACVGPCHHTLFSSPMETVKKITQHPGLTLDAEQRRTILSLGDGIPDSDVIIASAVSANHYDEMQAMFKNLHNAVYPMLDGRIEVTKQYPNLLLQKTKSITVDSNLRQLQNKVSLNSYSVVLFDIGLTPEMRRMTEKNCRCKVITFPKEVFPEHVYDNLCYSWKPLIVMAVAHHARKVVVWQDTSVRWWSGFLDNLDRAFSSGHQLLRYLDSDRVPAVTVEETFTYMQEEPCSFLPYPEIQANLHMHRVDTFNTQLLFEPWARCALEKQCMCPRPPISILKWGYGSPGHCHRFDQSAFSILLSRIYQQKLYKVMFQAFVFSQERGFRVARGDQIKNYFKP